MNIGYWNVNGYKSKFLGDKFRDQEFLKIIGECDILGIGEIQSEVEVGIEGFICKKHKIREKKSKGPKISGGIGLFVKGHVSHLVEVIPNNNDDSIWVRIKNEKNSLHDIYLGTFYVSPQYQNKNDDFFKNLNDEIEAFSKKGPVLLQGDLNARTGTSIMTRVIPYCWGNLRARGIGTPRISVRTRGGRS